MRKLLLSLVLLVPALAANAVEFTTLSRTQPITLVHTAEFSAYVNISLTLSGQTLTKAPLYLHISYIIGTDTLNDHMKVDTDRNGRVKQLLLKEGERLTALIYLHNADIDNVDGLTGSFRAVTDTLLTVSKDIIGSSFPGNVWIREHNPLFRIKLDEAKPRTVKLTFHLDGNYAFDDLHFKIKVISPQQGILLLPRTIDVTDEALLDFNNKTVTITIEGVNFSYPGSYYLQLMQTMKQDRVNGISKVSYEVITP